MKAIDKVLKSGKTKATVSCAEEVLISMDENGSDTDGYH
jgi:hypothetical protein